MHSTEKNLPLVSIGIPTYNNAQYLADAVKSAMAQDYANLEIIIINDDSPDSTSTLVESFITDPRVRYFKNEYNIGRVATYRKGLYDLSTGDWYLNLDGDDYFTDCSYISKAIDWAQSYENVVMVTSAGERRVNDNLDCVFRSGYDGEVSCIDGKTFFQDIPSGKACIMHCTTLYLRAKAMEMDFYNEDILSADFESLYRLALTGNIVNYNKVVGVWRIHGKNVSENNKFALNNIIRNFIFVEKPALFARSHLPGKTVSHWRKVMLVRILEGYILSVIIHKPGNSFVMLLRMFKKYPLLFCTSCVNIVIRNFKKLWRLKK